MWTHLEGRRRRAEDAWGGDEISTEDDMAHALFDGVPLPSCRAPVVPSMRIGAADDERSRVANQRRWRGHASPPSERAIYARPRSTRRGVPGALALYELAQLGPTGGLIARRLHAHIVGLAGIRTLDAWREVVFAIRDAEVAGSHDSSLLQPMRDAVLARIGVARARLASPPRLHQAAMFDRRAEHAAKTRLEVAARVDAGLARRAASLEVAHSLSGRVRLVAVWPLPYKS